MTAFPWRIHADRTLAYLLDDREVPRLFSEDFELADDEVALVAHNQKPLEPLTSATLRTGGGLGWVKKYFSRGDDVKVLFATTHPRDLICHFGGTCSDGLELRGAVKIRFEVLPAKAFALCPLFDGGRHAVTDADIVRLLERRIREAVASELAQGTLRGFREVSQGLELLESVATLAMKTTASELGLRLKGFTFAWGTSDAKQARMIEVAAQESEKTFAFDAEREEQDNRRALEILYEQEDALAALPGIEATERKDLKGVILRAALGGKALPPEKEGEPIPLDAVLGETAQTLRALIDEGEAVLGCLRPPKPVVEEAPAAVEIPLAEELPPAEASAPAETPIVEEAPAAEETPLAEELPPAEASAPAETPVVEEAPAPVETPLEEEIPPAEASAPAETPILEEAPAAVEIPLEEEIPPAEASAPAETPSSAPDSLPAQEPVAVAEETAGKSPGSWSKLTSWLKRPKRNRPPGKNLLPKKSLSKPRNRPYKRKRRLSKPKRRPPTSPRSSPPRPGRSRLLLSSLKPPRKRPSHLRRSWHRPRLPHQNPFLRSYRNPAGKLPFRRPVLFRPARNARRANFRHSAGEVTATKPSPAFWTTCKFPSYSVSSSPSPPMKRRSSFAAPRRWRSC